MAHKYAYLNGTIVPRQQASISVDDIGLLRGLGVFDFIETVNGRPFLLTEHLLRLRGSLSYANIHLSLTDNELNNIIFDLIQKNGFKESTIKIVVTGGKTPDGKSYDKNSPTIFILIDELSLASVKMAESGVKLITLEYIREIPEVKVLNYFMFIKTKHTPQAQGAFNVLYKKAGLITECATCNFFIFKGNKLITPQRNILKGITRDCVLKLAQGIFPIELRDVQVEELKEATESFLTVTSVGIAPVLQIDNLVIGNGKIGSNTHKLMQLFHDFAAKN